MAQLDDHLFPSQTLYSLVPTETHGARVLVTSCETTLGTGRYLGGTQPRPRTQPTRQPTLKAMITSEELRMATGHPGWVLGTSLNRSWSGTTYSVFPIPIPSKGQGETIGARERGKSFVNSRGAIEKLVLPMI